MRIFKYNAPSFTLAHRPRRLSLMLFIVKLFPEIIVKSKHVRKQMTRRLQDNLLAQLRPIAPECKVKNEWDRIVVTLHSDDETTIAQCIAIMQSTSGIAHFLEVSSQEFTDLEDLCEKVAAEIDDQLVGKSFVVRAKRSGDHDFNSHQLEQKLGGYLFHTTENGGVKLKNPDVTVAVEVKQQTLSIVKVRHQGLGGYPLGEIEPVMSLISGGFDSPVASYLTMKRGMPTHFCFFNLGGRDHELGVKEVSYYLWNKFGANRRVKFISVPFEGIVGELLQNIDNSQMGVILKRMMLRAAERVAVNYQVSALVTGEAIAQVSSQTLTNLNVIDSVTDSLVLRPLICSDKEDIIAIARKIGTEEFAASMPEYCGVISVKPTTRAKMHKIEAEEANFNFDVLEDAIARAEHINIDELANLDTSKVDVDMFAAPIPNSAIIDVRHHDEQERAPLKIAGQEIILMPFYNLHSKFAELPKDKKYLLFCDKGVMSKLHAAHLVEDGFDVGVYRPA